MSFSLLIMSCVQARLTIIIKLLVFFGSKINPLEGFRFVREITGKSINVKVTICRSLLTGYADLIK